MSDGGVPLPPDELRAAAPDPDAHAALDALHAELGAEAPNRSTIEQHVEGLRRWPAFVAPLERWYLDPRTQAFLAELNATGL